MKIIEYHQIKLQEIYNEKETIEQCRAFIFKKFGEKGYAREKMYFIDTEYSKYLDEITKLASNEIKFKEEICKINNIN